MADPLPLNAPVRILKHRRKGCTGTIAHYSEPCRFYTVRLDDNGRHDGPYCRRELELLTDPPQGRHRPTTPDKEVRLCSGAAV